MGWIEQLKPGSRVVVMPYNDERQCYIALVAEVAEDYVRLDNGLFFDKAEGKEKYKVGWQIGNSVTDNWMVKIRPLDDEAKRQIAENNRWRQLKNEIARVAWGDLPVDALEKVAQVIRQYQ